MPANSGIVSAFAASLAGAVGSMSAFAASLKAGVVAGFTAAGTAAGQFAAFMTGTTVATVKSTIANKAKAVSDTLVAKAVDLKTAAVLRYKAAVGGSTAATVLGTKAAYGQAAAQGKVAASSAAAATGMKGFVAAAGPLAAVAAAVIAVGVAWDTYAQIAKGADEANDALSAGNKELKEQLRELGAVVDETNKEKWEKAREAFKKKHPTGAS